MPALLPQTLTRGAKEKHCGVGDYTEKMPRHPRRFESPFPPLQLLEHDKQRLATLGQSLVQDHVNEYENFVREDEGVLPPDEWKLVQQECDLSTYLRRRTGDQKGYKKSWRWATPRHVRASEHSSSSVSDVSTEFGENLNEMADFRTVATLSSNLNDIMYGLSSHTIEEQRISDQYADKAFNNVAVLATILEPNLTDPFQTLTVRYYEMKQSTLVRSLAKNHDYVYIDYCGTGDLANGERIGFRLLHSVNLPETHQQLSNTVRGEVASCTLYRQIGENSVDVFVRTFVYVGGELQRPLYTKMIAKHVTSLVTTHSLNARMKKLAYALRNRSKEDRSKLSMGGESVCGTCDTVIRQHPLGYRSHHCSLCDVRLCMPCQMKEKMYYIDRDNSTRYRLVTFCVGCLDSVNRWDASDVASDDLKFRTSSGGTIH